jgi:hypothetical protein
MAPGDSVGCRVSVSRLGMSFPLEFIGYDFFQSLFTNPGKTGRASDCQRSCNGAASAAILLPFAGKGKPTPENRMLKKKKRGPELSLAGTKPIALW